MSNASQPFIFLLRVVGVGLRLRVVFFEFVEDFHTVGSGIIHESEGISSGAVIVEAEVFVSEGVGDSGGSGLGRTRFLLFDEQAEIMQLKNLWESFVI